MPQEKSDNDATAPQTSNTASRLLALPSELLQLILEYVLDADPKTPIPIYWPALLPLQGDLNHSILITNKHLRKKSLKALFKLQTFTIMPAGYTAPTGSGRWWNLAQSIRKLRQTVEVDFRMQSLFERDPVFVVRVPGPRRGRLVGTATTPGPGPFALWNTRNFPELRELTVEFEGMRLGVKLREHDYERREWMRRVGRQLVSCVWCAEMGILEPRVVGLADQKIARDIENAMQYDGKAR